MPGHVDGISCGVEFLINPTDPVSAKGEDWRDLERSIREGLRITGHKVRDVNVVHMHATGVSIGKQFAALQAQIARLKAERSPRKRARSKTRKTTRRRS